MNWVFANIHNDRTRPCCFIWIMGADKWWRFEQPDFLGLSHPMFNPINLPSVHPVPPQTKTFGFINLKFKQALFALLTFCKTCNRVFASSPCVKQVQLFLSRKPEQMSLVETFGGVPENLEKHPKLWPTSLKSDLDSRNTWTRPLE